jgi:hypothetical protein
MSRNVACRRIVSKAVVLPDGAPSQRDKQSTGRRALFAVAAVALAIGALTLGALTSPDSEAVAETSTTTTTTIPLDRPVDYDNFTVDQIATGEQFQWSQVAEVPGGWTSSLVSQLGFLYMFTSSRTLTNGEPAGLRAYRSFDAANWKDLGEVVSGNGYFENVAATAFGLMAVSTDASDGSIAVWRSTDALNWEGTVIEQTNPGFGTSFFSQALGASDSLAVIAGAAYENGSPLLRERLEEYGIEFDPQSMNWNVVTGGQEARVVLYGPLGIPAVSIAASEIGLTDEELQVLQGRSLGYVDVRAWSSSDGVNWTSGTIEDADWISSITPAPNGGLLVFGGDSAGNASWRTYDGVDFEKQPFGPHPEIAEPWRGEIAGVSYYSNPEVMVSSDGETWSQLGLAEHFPRRIGWTWYPTALATSDSGIAVTVAGNIPAASQNQRERTPPVLERDGVTLTVDLDQGVMNLDDGESERTWPLWNRADVAEDMILDLGERTITFLDSSGNPQVTFTFDELESVEMAYWSSDARDDTVHALAFSKDGNSWSIQDLDEVFGAQADVVNLAATPFSLVAVVRPSANDFLTPGEGELQIWSAPLPGR